jgi:ADP-ribose pyrophosphatase YjhB (NUDIX family)
MTWRPRVTVAAVIERDGRFLLVEEEKAEGLVLNQPAGHLEEGESLIQAVVREVLEETAHDFEPRGIVGLYRWQIPPRGDTYLRCCFFGEALHHHRERPLDPDIHRALWLDPSELAQARLRSPLVARAIEDYRAGRAYPLELLVELAP